MNFIRGRTLRSTLLALGLSVLAAASTAQRTFTANATNQVGGTNVAVGQSAKAIFSFNQQTDQLTIQLFNMGTPAGPTYGTNNNSADVLTGLFFNATVNGVALQNSSQFTLAGSAANLNGGSTVGTIDPTSPTGAFLSDPSMSNQTVVQQSWARKNNVSVGSFNALNGGGVIGPSSLAISSTNLGTKFLDRDRFDPTGSSPTNDRGDILDGPNYGLVNGTALGFDDTTAVINNSTVYTFQLTGTVNGLDISNVYFNYDSNRGPILRGTSGGSFTPQALVPEPAYVQMASLIALGGAGSLLQMRRARRRNKAASAA